MLKALFADEDGLSKLTKYGLASGVVFFLMAVVVYDRMTDSASPAPGLMPLVGLLVFLAALIVVVSVWGNLEKRRMAYESLHTLAKQANVSNLEELKQFFELDSIKSSWDMVIQPLHGASDESRHSLAPSDVGQDGEGDNGTARTAVVPAVGAFKITVRQS